MELTHILGLLAVVGLGYAVFRLVRRKPKSGDAKGGSGGKGDGTYHH